MAVGQSIIFGQYRDAWAVIAEGRAKCGVESAHTRFDFETNSAARAHEQVTREIFAELQLGMLVYLVTY